MTLKGGVVATELAMTLVGLQIWEREPRQRCSMRGGASMAAQPYTMRQGMRIYLWFAGLSRSSSVQLTMAQLTGPLLFAGQHGRGTRQCLDTSLMRAIIHTC